MTTITKKVKCATCKSYIHDTERCYVWQNKLYCSIDKVYKNECSCECCRNRCQYCNYYLNHNNVCCSGHNFACDRCIECNEFLRYGRCCWDHTKPLCQYCNLPIWKFTGICMNNHRENDPICHECNIPQLNNHEHDGVKCKKCNSLLNHGKCIYNCINGGNICIYCNIEGVYNNYCSNCKKDNFGKLTKRAIK